MFAEQNNICYKLNEDTEQGYEKDDIISHDTLLVLLQTYGELSVTVISIQ